MLRIIRFIFILLIENKFMEIHKKKKMDQENLNSMLEFLTDLKQINFIEKVGDERAMFYLARDVRNNQNIFIKKIVLSKDYYGEYQHEVDALCSLKGHPNIVGLPESGIYSDYIEGKWYNYGNIILEFAGKKDLCDALREYQWKYDEDHIISFAFNLIKTIKFIHSKGYIHRDLKLENIVLNSISIDEETKKFSFNPKSFKIIDFGSSINAYEYMNNKDIQSLLTNFRGTYEYCPPEFIINRELTELYDIYSCGIILFALITHHFPNFDYLIDKSAINESILHKSIDYIFKPEEWENVSPLVQDLIKSMLEPDPQLRLTADELLEKEIFQNQI